MSQTWSGAGSSRRRDRETPPLAESANLHSHTRPPLAAAARTPWPSAGSPCDDLVRLGLRNGLGAHLPEQRVRGKVPVLYPLARLRVVDLGAMDARAPNLTKDAERIINRPKAKH